MNEVEEKALAEAVDFTRVNNDLVLKYETDKRAVAWHILLKSEGHELSWRGIGTLVVKGFYR